MADAASRGRSALFAATARLSSTKLTKKARCNLLQRTSSFGRAFLAPIRPNCGLVPAASPNCLHHHPRRTSPQLPFAFREQRQARHHCLRRLCQLHLPDLPLLMAAAAPAVDLAFARRLPKIEVPAPLICWSAPGAHRLPFPALLIQTPDSAPCPSDG